MGEVKDTVNGIPPKKPSKKILEHPNLITRIKDLQDEISRLVVIKDEDTQKEGDIEFANNTRKAALLRSAYSLLGATKVLLEEY